MRKDKEGRTNGARGSMADAVKQRKRSTKKKEKKRKEKEKEKKERKKNEKGR